MSPAVKICGLKTREAIVAAKGASYFGFVLFPPSPRYVTPEEAAALKKYATGKTVAVTVDADDNLLNEIVNTFGPDYVQLHGDETSERMRYIKKRFSIPVIKAFKIATASDLAKVPEFEEQADMLLFDTRSSDGQHGGTGKTFDWNILKGRKFRKPYFLSGGINIDNVENALRITDASMIDISSGLELSKGEKDPAKIVGFLNKIKELPL